MENGKQKVKLQVIRIICKESITPYKNRSPCYIYVQVKNNKKDLVDNNEHVSLSSKSRARSFRCSSLISSLPHPPNDRHGLGGRGVPGSVENLQTSLKIVRKILAYKIWRI